MGKQTNSVYCRGQMRHSPSSDWRRSGGWSCWLATVSCSSQLQLSECWAGDWQWCCHMLREIRAYVHIKILDRSPQSYFSQA